MDSDLKKFVNKREMDRIFGLTRPQWESEAAQMTHPEGREVRLAHHNTGTGIMVFDRSTGLGLSTQPLFNDDFSPPSMLIIGNHYPAGKLSLIVKKDLEAIIQSEIGPGYSANVTIERMIPPGNKFDGVVILITRVVSHQDRRRPQSE